jgi:hypothetical protein
MNQSVLLILSADYCNPELQSEFGAKLPACMVPLGPKVLLQHQVESAFDNIPDLRWIFVGMPSIGDSIRADSYVYKKWGKRVKFVPIEGSNSMTETFNGLLGAAAAWIKEDLATPIFKDDAWRVHVLNGDTLFTSGWNTFGKVMSQEDIRVFARSKELIKKPVEERLGIEYVGKMAFYFSVQQYMNFPQQYSYESLVQALNPVVIPEEDWLDFGHMTTYYRSRRRLLATRAFNSIKIGHNGHIFKYGETQKMKAELAWYMSAPRSVSMYAPQVDALRNDDSGYAMEYLPYPSLAELLVHGNHTRSFWQHIQGLLRELLNTMSRCEAPMYQWDDPFMLNKTIERVGSLQECYQERAFEIVDWLRTQKPPHHACAVHGDLCFSNILYDQRSDSIKIIDPRGPDTFGNQLYDLAKLFHSTAGAYDFAVADLEADANKEAIMADLSEFVLNYAKQRWNVDKRVIVGMTALLFYSMLPLHVDDMERCKRLLNRAEGAYRNWKNIYGQDASNTSN